MRWRRLSSRTLVWAWAVVAWTAAWSILVGNTCTPGIKYVYDENGRLIAVVDDVTQAADNAAVYHYDAAGNITSIERVNGSTVRIFNFTPACAPTGSTLIINGLGMVASGASTTVSFNNGTPVTPLSADDTRLTVQVPSNATSGPITVQVGSPSATSSQSFDVGCAATAPTVTGLNPTSGVPGDSITVTGTQFMTVAAQDRVRFNGHEGQVVGAPISTSLTVKVPIGATSGRVTVSTPFGTGISPMNFITPPPGPPSLALANIALGSPVRITPTGTSTVTVTTAGNAGMFLFDGTAGGRISLRATTTFTTWPVLRIYAPDDTLIYATPNDGGSGTWTGWIDALTLPQDGVYSVVVYPLTGSLTGSITCTVYDASDVTVPILSDGSATHLTIANPGQNARFTFNAVLGYRVVVQVPSPDAASIWDNFGPDPSGRGLKLLDSAGNMVAAADRIVTRAIDAVNVSGGAGASGGDPYTIFVDLKDQYTGDVTARLYHPVDIDTTITVDAVTATHIATTTVGQNAIVRFDSPPGNRTIRFTNWSASFCLSANTVTLRSLNGNEVYSISNCGGPQVKTLTTGGTYRLDIDPPIDPGLDPSAWTVSFDIQVTTN